MADKKLNSITFPGIADRYILDSGHVEYDLTETYSDGTVGKALNDKANTNGYYENLGSGYADNLATDIRAASQVPYGFQTAGGSVDIGDREYLNAVVGGSLPINQLVNPSNIVESVSANDVVGTGNKTTGEVNINGTASPSDASLQITSGTWYQQKDHIYYLYQPSGASASTFFVRSSTDTFWNFKHIGKGNDNGTINLRVLVKNGQQVNFTFKPMLIDLTLLLGSQIADYIYTLESGTAGAGVAWCKAHFPKIFNSGYLAYNAGTMEHVTGVSSHDTVGFNQWDEEAEIGSISTSDGQNELSSTRMRSKNYIPCIPNTVYSGIVGTGAYLNLFYYDINKNYISYTGATLNGSNTFTTPSNAAYMRFLLQAAYGTTYNNDICINLAWDNSRNGEYEAFIKRTYPLDDSLTLRGIPKLDASNNLYYDGDVYAYDGTVTRRYGIVDLGTLTWDVNNANQFFASLPVQSPQNYLTNAICSKYIVSEHGGYDVLTDKTITITKTRAWVYDTAYSSAATFKTAMSGVYLVYELATPTTESADPYQQVQIVDDFGTEEFVTTGLVPVGHNSEYPVNLKAKLEMTPNSPSGNGDYVLQQSSGVNTYVDLGATNTITGIISRIEALEALHQ